MLMRSNPTIVDALEEGKVLYMEKTYYDKLVSVLQDLKLRGLKKSKTSIIVPSS